MMRLKSLELLEGLFVALRLVHLQRVELDRLGEGAALANSHHVADLNVSEAGGHVNGHVLVALLEPVVLLDVVKVVAADHHSVLHLHLGDGAGEHAAADGHVAGEGALLVNVVALASLSGDLESEAWVLHPSGLCLLDAALLPQEHRRLLLVAPLGLISRRCSCGRRAASRRQSPDGCRTQDSDSRSPERLARATTLTRSAPSPATCPSAAACSPVPSPR